MLDLFKYFAPHIFDLDKDHCPEGLDVLHQKGFEVLLKENIIDYYKFISKDRVLFIDQRPGNIMLVLEPGIVPPEPALTTDQTAKKMSDAVLVVRELFPHMLNAKSSDPKIREDTLEAQRTFFSSAAKDMYMYFQPFTLLAAITSQLRRTMLDITEAEFPEQAPKVEALVEDLTQLTLESTFKIMNSDNGEHTDIALPIVFRFDEHAMSKLNGFNIFNIVN